MFWSYCIQVASWVLVQVLSLASVWKNLATKKYTIATVVTYMCLVTYTLKLSLMQVMMIIVITLSFHFQEMSCDQTPASDWLNKMDTRGTAVHSQFLHTSFNKVNIYICINESPDIYHR